MLACQDKETITLHELVTSKKRRFSAKDLSAPTFANSVMGKKVFAASGNETGVIHVWDINRGKERWAFETGVAFILANSLVLSSDER